MSEIVTGWYAPRNWKEPDPKFGAIWTGENAPETEDMDAIGAAGWQVESGTLLGTQHIDWNAPDYAHFWSDVQLLNPWETLAKPGGRGSAAYKFQALPPNVIVAGPDVCAYNDNGDLVMTRGGELVHVVAISATENECRLITGIEVTYNNHLDVQRYFLVT